MREMVEHLREEIKHFDYVVQRNWEDLPELDPNHPDLDLFVSEEDYSDMLLITQQYPWIDLRHPDDGYYPLEISQYLLVGTRDYNGWRIPSKYAHFLSLYYHDAVHKKDSPYSEKLRTLFLEIFPPTKPEDEGVSYYGNH